MGIELVFLLLLFQTDIQTNPPTDEPTISQPLDDQQPSTSTAIPPRSSHDEFKSKASRAASALEIRSSADDKNASKLARSSTSVTNQASASMETILSNFRNPSSALDQQKRNLRVLSLETEVNRLHEVDEASADARRQQGQGTVRRSKSEMEIGPPSALSGNVSPTGKTRRRLSSGTGSRAMWRQRRARSNAILIPSARRNTISSVRVLRETATDDDKSATTGRQSRLSFDNSILLRNESEDKAREGGKSTEQPAENTTKPAAAGTSSQNAPKPSSSRQTEPHISDSAPEHHAPEPPAPSNTRERRRRRNREMNAFVDFLMENLVAHLQPDVSRGVVRRMVSERFDHIRNNARTHGRNNDSSPPRVGELHGKSLVEIVLPF